MPILPIPSVDALGSETASEAILIEYLHQIHATPSQIALAEAKAEASKTIEERARNGDALAIEELIRNVHRLAPEHTGATSTPISQHAPGAHEDGKGDVIDLYD